MKKIIIPFMLAFTSSMANAEYLIKIPFEQAQGGPLPNNSIVFVSSTEVVPETPVKDEPIDCLTNPTDNPQLCEKSLTAWEQFATDRDLPQTWSDLSWGNKGLSYIPNAPYPITSVDILNLVSNQLTNVDGLSNLTSVGSLNLGSNQLTNVEGLSKLTSVSKLYLSGNPLTNVNGLSNLTSARELHLSNIPLTNVNGLSNLTSVYSLSLSSNKLTNVDGLSNLTNADYLVFSSNQITNVNGLSNLTRVVRLDLNINKLTNVDGLSNLTSVGTLYLYQNQLTNVNGLANLKVTSTIAVDATYSGPKLAANTIFCTKNSTSVFTVGFARKSQLCK